MLLPETDPTGGWVLAEKIRQGVAEADLAVDGIPIPTSVSVGVVTYPQDGQTVRALLECADAAMYRSKRAGRDRVSGVPVMDPESTASRGIPAARCSIRGVTSERPGPGPSTRAIRAASRQPVVRQSPTSVPIYQTATFSSGDAEELAAVLTGEQPGYAYSRIDNPTVVALGDAVAELHGAEAGIALATGMAAIHATFLSHPARRRPAAGRPGGLRDDAHPGGLGVRAARRRRLVRGHDRCRCRRGVARLGAHADPACRDHRQPDLRARGPAGPRRGGPPPWCPADGRQHVRLAGGLPPARARRRSRDGVGHQVPVRATPT